MATAILSAQRHAVEKQYELPDAEQRALHALADKPDRRIPRRMLRKVERQRINFIRLHGNEFGLQAKTATNLLQQNFLNVAH